MLTRQQDDRRTDNTQTNTTYTGKQLPAAQSCQLLLLNSNLIKTTHPVRPQNDHGGGAPEAHHTHLQRASQVHPKNARNHGTQSGCKAGYGQQQLQPVDLQLEG